MKESLHPQKEPSFHLSVHSERLFSSHSAWTALTCSEQASCSDVFLLANISHQLSKHLAAQRLATTLLKVIEIETAGEWNFTVHRTTDVKDGDVAALVVLEFFFYALHLLQHSTDDLTASSSMDVHFHSCDHIYYCLYIPVIHTLVNKSWQLSLVRKLEKA